jgi:hypothetical protein
MPDSKSRDEGTLYGPVPYEVRQPAKHWDPEKRPLNRPLPDLRPARQDPRALNRLTEKPKRATGTENKALRKYSDIPPLAERLKPPPFEQQKKEIDEEEKDRLTPLDGYNKPLLPEPREGFGLKLQPRPDDINKYFKGPEYRYDRPFLETAESRGLTPPIGPWGVPGVQHREEGETVRRKKPKPKPKPLAPTPEDHRVEGPPPHKEETFKAHNIRFKVMNRLNMGKPAEFADPQALDEIDGVAKYLRENPDKQVEIRASVGWDSRAPRFLIPFAPDPNKIMEKRAEAVSRRLEAQGIDPARIRIRHDGKVGEGEDDRVVEFIFP